MEFELIDFIKENPVLYDKKYRSLHYRQEKIDKWNEIARRLRRDPSTLRMKWKGLRDNFKKRLQRQKGDEEDALTSRNWKYHNHLMFLKDVYTEPALDYKTEDAGDSEPEMSQLEEEQHLSNEQEFEVETFDLNDYLKKFDASALGKSSTQNNATSSDDTSKKKKFDKDTIIGEACQQMTCLLQNAKEHFTPPSATQTFFNSVAMQVVDAKLPALDLLRLQQKVLEVVTQEIVMYQNREYES